MNLFETLHESQKQAYDYEAKSITLLSDEVAITGLLFAEFEDTYFVLAAGFIGEYPKRRWRRV